MTGSTVSILLVEDDDIDAEGVERALEKAYIANPRFRARDGVEALEMLRGENGHEAIPTPHLLLVDINMPRMDGIEFMTEIRKDEKLKKSIAFILTTSNGESDKIEAYNLNVAGYLVKSKVGDNFVDMIDMLDHFWKIVEFPQ